MKINVLIFSTLLFMLVSCSSNGQKKVGKDNLSDEAVLIEYAIFLLDNDSLSEEDAIEKIKTSYKKLGILDSLPNPENVNEKSIVISGTDKVATEFTPPDLEYLEYAGRGLNDQEKRSLQKTNYVLILDFVCKKNDLIETLSIANDFILDITKDKKVVIYDTETRESFSRTFWKENRKITKNSVNLSEHITIHLYPEGDYCRAITLGMLKFGLPDICIENVSCYSSLGVANLINLSAQTLFEQQQLNSDGELMLDIDAINNLTLKEQLESSLAGNSEKRSPINLVEGVNKEGDPVNRLIEISFQKENPQIEQEALINKIFGFEDEVTYLKHDDELLNASERAKETALKLKDSFNKGFPVGTTLLLKFPFSDIEGDNEWMWVEVIKWKGEMVTGLLQNEPQMVTSVKNGEEVTKNFDEMFDYILYHPDGTREGNETGEIMQRNAN